MSLALPECPLKIDSVELAGENWRALEVSTTVLFPIFVTIIISTVMHAWVSGLLESSIVMTKPARGGFSSFRKPVKQVGALPQSAAKQPVEVWRPKLKDRVQTPSGAGIVVEISSDMYLIDLENQVAKIWERLSSIRLPK